MGVSGVVAAVYARRSNEQHVAEEAKSVTRQVENARLFALKRGCTVADEHVFVDDGVSGAEFERRPGLQRLLTAVRARAPFDVLVVAEQKAIGREMTEVAHIIKRLAQAGVEVWSYMEDRCLTPRGPTDKLLTMVQGFADEDHRVKTSARMREAHARLAARGRVTGNRRFGYRNRPVYAGTDASGNPLRSHVEYEVVPEEAAVIQQIFHLYGVEELGLKTIARQLNAEGVLAPRPFRRKDGSLPAPAWATSTVREILRRPIYVGRPTWGEHKKRDDWGRVAGSRRPQAEWVRAERPDLSIVSDAAWDRVQARLTLTRETALRFELGRLAGRPPKHGAINLLASLAACGLCGAGLVVETSSGPRRDAFPADALPAPGERVAAARSAPYRFYVCYTRRHKGTCPNRLRVPAADVEEAVLLAVEEHVFTPEAIEQVVALTDADETRKRRKELDAEAKDVGRKIERLVNAVAEGADAKPLVDKLRELEVRQRAIEAEAEALRPLPRPPARVVESRLAEWRRMLRANVTQGREVLRRVLKGRIKFTPTADARGYEFECPTRFDRIFTGMAFPVPTVPGFLKDVGEAGLEHITPEDTFDGDYERVLAGGRRNADGAEDGKLWRPWRAWYPFPYADQCGLRKPPPAALDCTNGSIRTPSTAEAR